MRRKFVKVVADSLHPDQMNHIGQKVDGKFDIYRESGISSRLPLPRQTAAAAISRYFNKEEDIIDFFTLMIQNEGKKLSGATIFISDKEKFISFLEQHKWVYDDYLEKFTRDPFYENEINLLKTIRVIDLRGDYSADKIIKTIEAATNSLGIQDLEWRITVRLYHLDAEKEMLLRKCIELLLIRQDLTDFVNEVYVCLKELIVNSSKANFKLLFEKYHTRKDGITSRNNYEEFLTRFRKEIYEHGSSRLSELARRDDMFFNVFFQSSPDSIALWVSNYTEITELEKERIKKKIREGGFEATVLDNDDDDHSEGAGFGISLILSILKTYSSDPEPLKVIFYPELFKMGFFLKRSDLKKKPAK